MAKPTPRPWRNTPLSVSPLPEAQVITIATPASAPFGEDLGEPDRRVSTVDAGEHPSQGRTNQPKTGRCGRACGCVDGAEPGGQGDRRRPVQLRPVSVAGLFNGHGDIITVGFLVSLNAIWSEIRDDSRAYDPTVTSAAFAHTHSPQRQTAGGHVRSGSFLIPEIRPETEASQAGNILNLR